MCMSQYVATGEYIAIFTCIQSLQQHSLCLVGDCAHVNMSERHYGSMYKLEHIITCAWHVVLVDQMC